MAQGGAAQIGPARVARAAPVSRCLRVSRGTSNARDSAAVETSPRPRRYCGNQPLNVPPVDTPGTSFRNRCRDWKISGCNALPLVLLLGLQAKRRKSQLSILRPEIWRPARLPACPLLSRCDFVKLRQIPWAASRLQASSIPDLRDLGFESALAVVLTDKETQAPAGAMLVGDAAARKWKPNESFFLQAVGDQLVLSVSHTRLRSLVRSLAVADERTGLLSRSSYIDCLLMESNRARSQGTPLSLIIVQADRGGDLLRQHGDAAVEKYVEHLCASALLSSVRHWDLDIAIKYTAWSLVFVLPNTSLEKCHRAR